MLGYGDKIMLKKKLTIYKNKHKLTWDQVANKLEISRQGLENIIKYKSPATKVVTCLKIEALTGLKPWEYLDGLEKIKKLIIIKK